MRTTNEAGALLPMNELMANLGDRVRPLAALAGHILNGRNFDDGHELAAGVVRLFEDVSDVETAVSDDMDRKSVEANRSQPENTARTIGAERRAG